MSKRLPTGRDVSCCNHTDINSSEIEMASDDSFITVIFKCSNCEEEREVVYEPTHVRSPAEVFK